MSEVSLLADQMAAIFADAGHWHVPVPQALQGLDSRSASFRAQGFANCTWELVEHMRWEIELVLNRLAGFPAPEKGNGRWENWPEAGEVGDEAAWAASVARLFAANEALVAHLRALVDADLDLAPQGRKHTRRRILQGMAGHASYHTGQIVMLRRLQDNWTEWTP